MLPPPLRGTHTHTQMRMRAPMPSPASQLAPTAGLGKEQGVHLAHRWGSPGPKFPAIQEVGGAYPGAGSREPPPCSRPGAPTVPSPYHAESLPSTARAAWALTQAWPFPLPEAMDIPLEVMGRSYPPLPVLNSFPYLTQWAGLRAAPPPHSALQPAQSPPPRLPPPPPGQAHGPRPGRGRAGPVTHFRPGGSEPRCPLSNRSWGPSGVRTDPNAGSPHPKDSTAHAERGAGQGRRNHGAGRA